MAIPLGFDAKIYYAYDPNEAYLVAAGGPTDGFYTLSDDILDTTTMYTGQSVAGMIELDVVTDVTLNMSKSEVDITNRSTSGFRAYTGTLKEGEISFDMMWETANTKFNDVFSAFYDNKSILFGIFDGAIAANAQGLYSSFSVLNFEKSEALEDAQRVSVSAKITLHGTVIPRWVKIV